MSFTPGPWNIRRLGPAEHYAIETSDGSMIAATAVTGNTLDDARLIAAALELLHALRVARANLHLPRLAVVEQIDAAIAKATGGAQ